MLHEQKKLYSICEIYSTLMMNWENGDWEIGKLPTLGLYEQFQNC